MNTDTNQPAGALRTLPTDQLLDAYKAWQDHIPRRLLDLDDEQLDTAFTESSGLGRWPARVLVGHLADCEIVYTHRFRRIVAEDNPILSTFDPDAMVDAGLYGNDKGGADKPVAAFVAVIHTTRTWTAEWLSTLDESAWDRSSLHPDTGPVSLKDALAHAVWHIEHHAQFLNRKLDRLLGQPDA